MEIDLREYAHKVLQQAKENLASDGYLVPIAFLVLPDQIVVADASFESHEEKQEVYARIVAAAREHNAQAIITLNDARRGSPAAAEGYYPGKLEAEKAEECIVIMIAGPGLTNWQLFQPYTREQDTIVFGTPEEESGGTVNVLGDWPEQ